MYTQAWENMKPPLEKKKSTRVTSMLGLKYCSDHITPLIKNPQPHGQWNYVQALRGNRALPTSPLQSAFGQLDLLLFRRPGSPELERALAPSEGR